MVTDTSQTPRCANHPDRETLLRCNRCEKPICLQCAVLTEVGYRCKECVRGQQAAYYNATRYDVPAAAAVALALGVILGVLAYLFLGAFGWFSFLGALLAGPVAGGLIAEAARRAVRKRRARGMRLAAAIATVAGVFLGGLLFYLAPGLVLGGSLNAGVWLLSAILFRLDVLLLAGLAASTVYARLL